MLPILILALLQPPIPQSNAPIAWLTDEVSLHNGAKFNGLLLKETLRGVEFQVVIRRAGRPTVTLTTTFLKNEVATVKRLSAEDRNALRAKIAELDPGGEGERQRMESLELTRIDWLGKSLAGRQYTSERFTIVSGASEELSRRAAVRLELLHAALVRYFPPRAGEVAPVRIEVAVRADDYAALLPQTLRALANPALYLPGERRIVCGSDLERLDGRLAEIKSKHQEERKRLDQYEAGVKQLYRQSRVELERHLLVVAQERQRLREADRRNETAFDSATQRFFALLYHEVFHAYIGPNVYPPADAESIRAGKESGPLPRYLEEGLAQIFETAILEVGELHIDHADESRLTAIQDFVRKPASRPQLAAMLRAGPQDYLSGHDERGRADRKYLSAWGLTFFLFHEKQALHGPEFGAYLRSVNTGGDPIKAFETWLGKDVAGIEAEWWDYLMRLTPSGRTTAPGPTRKP